MIQVKHETVANDIRIGDEVETPRRSSRTVSSVDKKAKWAYVNFTDGTKSELRLDAEVTLVRWEKTEEEIAAERLEYTLRSLQEKLQAGLADRAAGLVRKALERHEEKGYTMFTWSTLPDILQAEAEQRLYMQIEARRESLVERGISEADALLSAFYNTEAYASRSRMQNPLSRSTSTLSNLIEDLDAYVISELKSDLRWMMSKAIGEEAHTRVMAQLKAANQQD